MPRPRLSVRDLLSAPMPLPRPRFTIRELILVVALVAVLLGWTLDHARMARDRDAGWNEAEGWLGEAEFYREQVEGLEAEVNGLLHEQGKPEKYPRPGEP